MKPTIELVLVFLLVISGGWALLFTGQFLNTRQTQPSAVLSVRILYIVCVVVLILVYIGSIGNKTL